MSNMSIEHVRFLWEWYVQCTVYTHFSSIRLEKFTEIRDDFNRNLDFSLVQVDRQTRLEINFIIIKLMLISENKSDKIDTLSTSNGISQWYNNLTLINIEFEEKKVNSLEMNYWVESRISFR